MWDDEFGSGERLVRVLASQSANPWTGSTVLGWKEASKRADALAIAPYFGHRHGNARTAAETATMSPDALIEALATDVAEARKQIEANVGQRSGTRGKPRGNGGVERLPGGFTSSSTCSD